MIVANLLAVIQSCLTAVRSFFSSLQLNIFPARTSVLALFCPRAEVSRATEIAVTVALVMTSLLLAIYFPGLAGLFSLLGSSSGILFAFILPPAYYIKLCDKTHQCMRSVCWIMLISGCLLAVLSMIRSIQYLREKA